jgi:hypothetical protein
MRGMLPFEQDRKALRDWWHDVLREHDKTPCYAIFLTLLADKETIRYFEEYGKELDKVSGPNCWVIAIAEKIMRQPKLDPVEWTITAKKQTEDGYSISVAKHFGIELSEFPCMVVFQDVRSPDYALISFRSLTAEEIAYKLRSVFSIIDKAIEKNENPLSALKRNKTIESSHKIGEKLTEGFTNLSAKTLEMVMDAWIKTVIK